MSKKLIELISKTTLWLKRNQTIKYINQPIKINLGSGLSVAEGWINIDGSLNAFFAGFPKWFLRRVYNSSGSKQFYSQEEYIDILKRHIFIHHDMQYGLPFENDSVDFLYSSHMIEHLFFDDAKKLIKDAFRVLKKGGVFRVCIPDLTRVLQLYNEGQKDKALSYFFTQSRHDDMNTHRYMYDADMMESLLKDCGFSNINRRMFREGITPDIGILDNRENETLFIEAIK